jgi:hypothetical protein
LGKNSLNAFWLRQSFKDFSAHGTVGGIADDVGPLSSFKDHIVFELKKTRKGSLFSVDEQMLLKAEMPDFGSLRELSSCGLERKDVDRL